MADFTRIYERLQKAVLSKVVEEAGESIEDISKEILLEAIDEEVYKGAFQPNVYERRGENGGYKDRENLKTFIDDSYEDKIVFLTENVTTGSHDMYGNRIDAVIEYGEGYTWNRQPPPRPVFATAKEKLVEKKNEIIAEIEKAIK